MLVDSLLRFRTTFMSGFFLFCNFRAACSSVKSVLREVRDAKMAKKLMRGRARCVELDSAFDDDIFSVYYIVMLGLSSGLKSVS